ncbi:MAG: glycoside hydrolase family 3 N-terminal domain-containing protein [Bacteroidales bacterium]
MTSLLKKRVEAKIIRVFICLILFLPSCKDQPKNKVDEKYKDPSVPIKARVESLLSQMTLEEKVAQTLGYWRHFKNDMLDAEGDFSPEKAKALFNDGNGIGQISLHYDEGGGKNAKGMAELTNQMQKFIISNNRLGIPALFHGELLHGHAALDGTSFPVPIGMASTWDTALVKKLYSMAAEEARSRGLHLALTPVLDVAREPRWGRVEETFGEDPFLIAQMGIAVINGFQGDRAYSDKKHLFGTLKHFGAHGVPENGSNCSPADISERTLREVHLYPFKEVVQKAHVKSIMASYNEIDGVPSHANKWLLRKVLRQEWGFDGFVVSDYQGVKEINLLHSVAENFKEAANLAINAGVNFELPDPYAYPFIKELVKEGKVKESVLDDLVRANLTAKFEMGLFDDPYVDPEKAEIIVGSKKNGVLALEAAREVITLLKNEGNIVPLNREKFKTIAVIGPNANVELLGGYSGIPKKVSTVLQGIKEKVGDRIKVLYSEGCKITVGGSWASDTVTLSKPDEDVPRIKEAVRIALQSDIVVLAIGGNEQTSREAWDKNHMGDRASLELVGMQNELVKAIIAVGKPVVVLLFNGSPLAINEISKSVPAIFECWYLGQATGEAVADVLFGDFNPGGRLPISIPRSAGHIPDYYNYKPSARRGYLFADITPLYPFGYGLSYTTFKIKNLRIEKPIINKDESTRVMVDVTNTGEREGHEVVQMYIRDSFSSVTRPVKELKGFAKVFLEPGETKTITLEIIPELLSFYDIDMNYIVEPGEFAIMVGSSSRDEDLIKAVLTVKSGNKK